MARRLVLIAAFFLSCGQKFDEQKARQEINALISTHYQDWFLLTAGSEPSDSTIIDTIPKIVQGDTLLKRWWRYGTVAPDSAAVSTDISFDSDTSASVIVTTDLSGKLAFTLGRLSSDFNQEKNIIDAATRPATFYHDAASDSWRLKEISWAEIVSDTVVHPTINIRKIEFNQTAFADTTLDHLWPLAEILHFQPRETVATRLTTYEDTTGAVAVLSGPVRKRFLPDGKTDNTWVSSFTAPAAPGRYRLVIDLVKRRTFFDATYPYDSNRWVIDYEVK